MASTTLSMCPKAVIMMTAVWGCLARRSRRNWMPSTSGRRRATNARAGSTCSASVRPPFRVPALITALQPLLAGARHVDLYVVLAQHPGHERADIPFVVDHQYRVHGPSV